MLHAAGDPQTQKLSKIDEGLLAKQHGAPVLIKLKQGSCKMAAPARQPFSGCKWLQLAAHLAAEQGLPWGVKPGCQDGSQPYPHCEPL